MLWKYKDLMMYHETIGSGIPVFMLHGYSVDHHIMSGCMEPIFTDSQCDGYQRIYPDLPGMGRTQAVSWIENADILLDVLLRYIHDTVGDTPFVLVSESYGSYLARGIMRAIPTQVLASLFICPVILPEFSRRTLPEFHISEKTDIGQFSAHKDFDGFSGSMVVQTPHTWKRYQADVLTGINLADTEYLKVFQQKGYAFSFAVDDIETSYSFPVIFFTGRQDDCVGFQDAWNILKNYKNASFLALNNAGHNLQIDQEGMFDFIAAQWLCEVRKLAKA